MASGVQAFQSAGQSAVARRAPRPRPSKNWWKVMTMSRMTSSSVPASVSPTKSEWNTTPNSSMRSAVSCEPYPPCESPSTCSRWWPRWSAERTAPVPAPAVGLSPCSPVVGTWGMRSPWLPEVAGLSVGLGIAQPPLLSEQVRGRVVVGHRRPGRGRDRGRGCAAAVRVVVAEAAKVEAGRHQLDEEHGHHGHQRDALGPVVVGQQVAEAWVVKLLVGRRQQVDEGCRKDNAGAEVLGHEEGRLGQPLEALWSSSVVLRRGRCCRCSAPRRPCWTSCLRGPSPPRAARASAMGSRTPSRELTRMMNTDAIRRPMSSRFVSHPLHAGTAPSPAALLLKPPMTSSLPPRFVAAGMSVCGRRAGSEGTRGRCHRPEDTTRPAAGSKQEVSDSAVRCRDRRDEPPELAGKTDIETRGFLLISAGRARERVSCEKLGATSHGHGGWVRSAKRGWQHQAASVRGRMRTLMAPGNPSASGTGAAGEQQKSPHSATSACAQQQPQIDGEGRRQSYQVGST